MSTARRSLAGAAVAALAVALPAAPAAADGLPLPIEDSPNGVASPGGAVRYLTVTLAGRTMVLAQKASTGAVTSRVRLRGSFGIPLVAYDGSAGGISGDGRTLVLIRPRRGFPRRDTTFAVVSTQHGLRVRRSVHLRGDFSYDALSPDGRGLFLINYLSPNDPTKYRVRVYDLARNRLAPGAIVDPHENADEMNGIALGRVMSRDSRWAYTLYQRGDGKPFIHALDTRDRKAVCIDLDDPALAGPNYGVLRLRLAARGARVEIRRRNGEIAGGVDTATLRVLSRPEAVRAARAEAAAGNPAGPGILAVVLTAGVLGGLLLALSRAALGRRRRSETRSSPSTAPATSTAPPARG